MEVSFVQGKGLSPSVSEDELSMMYPGVTKVDVDLGDGYVVHVYEEDDDQVISMTYADGQTMIFESINK